jgi:hypothetical protein
MGYSFLADVLVAIHLAFVAFVIVGQMTILVGIILHWTWVRNFWFRLAHLAAIGFVALEAVFQVDCPLTVWEDQLRRLAGQDISEGSFIGRGIHAILFYDCPPGVLNAAHIAFALLVLATFVLAPPRWPHFLRPSPRVFHRL